MVITVGLPCKRKEELFSVAVAFWCGSSHLPKGGSSFALGCDSYSFITQ